MCNTQGWKVVKENTLQRMEGIKAKLANGTFTDFVEVIKLQVEYKTLAGILNQYDIREE